MIHVRVGIGHPQPTNQEEPLAGTVIVTVCDPEWTPEKEVSKEDRAKVIKDLGKK